MLRQDSKDPNAIEDAADELPPEAIKLKLRRTLSTFGEPAGEEDLGFNEDGEVVNTKGLDLKDYSNKDLKRASPEIKQEFRVFVQNNPDKNERVVVDSFVEAVRKLRK